MRRLTLMHRGAVTTAAVLLTAASSTSYVASAEPSSGDTLAIPAIDPADPANVTPRVVTTAAPPSTPVLPAGRAGNDIPLVAFAAYQRAESLLARSAPDCALPWALLAGIGKIESDHGRLGGGLDAEGRSVDGVYGVRLDGRTGTARIVDTDAGRLDHDVELDRAVGPMQFIPSTWASVAVDGDGDGRKDPQDIDDAALAAGVFLCVDDADLSTPAGQRAAALRYNHDPAYADRVLAHAARYEASGGVIAPVFQQAFGRLASPAQTSTPARSAEPADVERRPELEAPAPPVASPDVDPAPSPRPSTGPAPKPAARPAQGVLEPVEEATVFCTSTLSSAQASSLGGLTSCVEAYLRGGTGAVANLVAGLGGTLRTLLGRP